MNISHLTESQWAHPKDVAVYAAQIDRADVSSVLRYVRAPHSPIQDAMIVRRREDLPKVAALLSPRVPDACTPAAMNARSRRLETMFNERLIGLGVSSQIKGPKPCAGFSVSLERLNPDTACDVIRLAPFYVVHSPVIEWALDLGDRTRPQLPLRKTEQSSQLEFALHQDRKVPGLER